MLEPPYLSAKGEASNESKKAKEIRKQGKEGGMCIDESFLMAASFSMQLLSGLDTTFLLVEISNLVILSVGDHC